MRKLLIATALCFGLAQVAIAQTAYDGGGNKFFSSWTQTGQAALSAGITTSRAALGSAAPNAMVCNTGSIVAYVTLGNASVVATVAAGVPVLPGTCPVLDARGATNIAGITASSTAALVVATGSGHP